MNNQQLITKIETQIQETKEIINIYKQQIASHENSLLALAQQLTRIKINIQENKQIK